jgi:hypothetical protein
MALYPLLSRINAYLMRWIRKNYKRLRIVTPGSAGAGRTNPLRPPNNPH